jgi:hypothetical protein
MPDLDLSHSAFNPFASKEVSPPYSREWESKRRLARALRELSELLVTSEAAVTLLDRTSETVEELNRELSEAPRCFGLGAFIRSGEHGGYAEVNHEINAVGGRSNPLAPDLNIWLEGHTAHGVVRCGYAYEGPPGFIHGGYVAAIFDQFLGMAQVAGGQPGMTGSLSVRYLRPTPLNTDLKLTATLEKTEGRKSLLRGKLVAGEAVTATAEGLFVRPARGLAGLALPD